MIESAAIAHTGSFVGSLVMYASGSSGVNILRYLIYIVANSLEDKTSLVAFLTQWVSQVCFF